MDSGKSKRQRETKQKGKGEKNEKHVVKHGQAGTKTPTECKILRPARIYSSRKNISSFIFWYDKTKKNPNNQQTTYRLAATMQQVAGVWDDMKGYQS